ncbi:MAG TPA: tetratricopeptide repeat protein [Clostridia bacterium]|nr:tetratricopeptide repeat protein [Clostridia bacterium]
MEKVIRVGKVILIFTLILALTSCSNGIAANKTVMGPSKESVDIFNKFAALVASIKYTEARKLLEDKYDIIKDNDTVLNNYGFMEFHIFNNYEKAEGLFERAIKVNPENSEHYRGMGCIYEAKGQYREAIKYYEKAIKNTNNYEYVPINPKLADLHTAIGNCYLKLNNRKKAMEALENASGKNPFSIEANAALHKLYVEAEGYEKAYKVWKNDNLIGESTDDNIYKGVIEWNRLYKDAVEGKKNVTHLQMASLYATLVLYDEAVMEYKKALVQDQTNEDIRNKLYEMELYLSFRDELNALLDDYYRERCINGMKEELNFYRRIKPAYEKIAVLFPKIKNYSGGTALSTNILNEEIEKKFGVRIANIKANGSMLGAHFGRIIDSSMIHSALWGEEIDLKVITLKNMISNGLDCWRFMESGGVGGWSISPTEIVMVIQDNEYDGELQVSSFYNEDAKEDIIKEYGGTQADIEESGPLQIYFSPNISFQFIDKQIITETEKAKVKGIYGSGLQRYIFNKLEKDFTVKTNIIHESQHSIDDKTGANFIWLGEAEYKAKLSQLAYGNMQFMCLNQFYSSDIGMEVNNTHTRANTQLFKDIVQYIYDSNDKFPQIDVKKNILAQLTKLSADDLKGIAIDVFQKNYPDKKYQ